MEALFHHNKAAPENMSSVISDWLIRIKKSQNVTTNDHHSHG